MAASRRVREGQSAWLMLPSSHLSYRSFVGCACLAVLPRPSMPHANTHASDAGQVIAAPPRVVPCHGKQCNDGRTAE